MRPTILHAAIFAAAIVAASPASAARHPASNAPTAGCDDRFLHSCNPPAAGRVATRHDRRVKPRRGKAGRPGILNPDRYRSPTLAGVVAPLARKVEEIVSTCGSRVVSAVRRTFIAGTRTMSLHASGRAVDLQGNPSCIYSLLGRSWLASGGGYTTDYHRAPGGKHVHVSFGGREAGRAFAHGGGRHKHAGRKTTTRYARTWR